MGSHKYALNVVVGRLDVAESFLPLHHHRPSPDQTQFLYFYIVADQAFECMHRIPFLKEST